MNAVRPPRRRLPRRAGEDEQKPSLAGDATYPLEQRAPLAPRRSVVPEDHTTTAWQPSERSPERIALPLVGHQPEAGQGARLAVRHRHAYSAAMPTADTLDSPAARLAAVREAIARSAALAGRPIDAVELIAISKTRTVEEIMPLIAAGQRSFGENRVQEAQAKWPELRGRTAGLRLHLVGQLQSNKAEDAVALFDAIHSVDRSSLVDALAKAMEGAGRRPDCFIQVNIGAEPQKGGCAIADLPALLTRADEAGLPIAGLMCVPPADVEAAPYFALLAKLARRHGLAGLSMGMSGDFETAAMLGATQIRIGTALFGARG